jgi:hypothetical protein
MFVELAPAASINTPLGDVPCAEVCDRECLVVATASSARTSLFVVAKDVERIFASPAIARRSLYVVAKDFEGAEKWRGG